MSIPQAPPPTYDQDVESQALNRSQCAFNPSEVQLLINPSGNNSQFQKGFLGARGEHAAIEGEIQIKGAPLSIWESL